MRTLWICVAMGVGGCVTEGARPGSDGVADVSMGDTADDSGGATGGDGAAGEAIAPGDDTSGSEDGIGDGTGGTDTPDSSVDCVGPSDCNYEPPTCGRWECVDQHCVITPMTGGTCDDGDACTDGDFCDAGHCRGARAVDCTALAGPCRIATGTCDPEQGCGFDDLAATTRCDDGAEPSAGSCAEGWRIGPDHCDGFGVCVAGDVPGGEHPLDGAWHVVLLESGDLGAFDSLAANLELAQGDITAGAVTATDTSWGGAVDREAASYCSDVAGPTTFALGGEDYRATFDAGHDYVVLDRVTDQTTGLAIRRDGRANQVDGAYRVVVAEHFGPATRTLVTRQGRMELSSGCLVGSFVINAPVDATIAAFNTENGSCFVAANDGLWQLSLDIDLGEGPFATYEWVGAIGPNGDVVLLTRRDDGFGYGMILMVRERDGDTPDITGDWSFASLRGGLSSPNQLLNDVVFETGLLSIGAGEEDIGGEVIRDGARQVLTGYWWAVDGGGRYSQRSSFGVDLLHHVGIVAPGDGLIVAWVAASPDNDPSEPRILASRPIEGSLLLGVRAPTSEP